MAHGKDVSGPHAPGSVSMNFLLKHKTVTLNHGITQNNLAKYLSSVPKTSTLQFLGKVLFLLNLQFR